MLKLRSVSLLITALTIGAASAPAHAEPPKPSILTGQIQIGIDQAKAFSVPPGTRIVVVGNPGVADAPQGLIEKEGIAIFSGRGYGETNVIALDGEGRELAKAQITVNRAGRNVVTVHTGPKRASFSCTPVCAPLNALGDSSEAFSEIASQKQQRTAEAGKQ